jgi:hypothetical protein
MTYTQHQQYISGEIPRILSLIPEKIVAHHMDTSNDRFQGSFFHKLGERYARCNEAPLEMLKEARKFKVDYCDCQGGHMIWTIWF